jgi:hypothetical protein
MSGITVIGPRGNQSHDDYLIELIHKVWRGDGNNPDLAPFPLTPVGELKLIAIGELYRMNKNSKPEFDENGSKLVTAKYNIPESVYMDLEMSGYGVSPMVSHLFPVMDSFAIVGQLDGNYAGFGVDFFGNVQRPTRTVAFAQSSDPGLVSEAGRYVFGLDALDGNPAYSAGNLRRELADRRWYNRKGDIEVVVREGTLQFGGDGKLQNEVVRGIVERAKGYVRFKPEQYILEHHDFKIDFGPKDGKARFNEGLTELSGRVQTVFQEKAKRYAA